MTGWALLAAGLLAACGGAAPADDLAVSESGLSRQLDTGRLIVKFKSSASASTKATVHRGQGARKKKSLRSGAEVVLVTKANTRSILARYKANANVEHAEIDALVPPDDTTVRRPNDPMLSYQWQHDAIQAPGAWAVGTGSTTVNLAVCDTGVSQTHPDLKANLRLDLCWNTANGAAGDCDPVNWHGTGVAGSAAAIGNNGVGLSGTAWAAKIIPVRVSNEFDGSAYISDMADCLTYSADKGAHVINLSYQTYDAGTIYQSILDAANYAETKGAVVFVASGNEGVNAVTSQDPTTVVFVGATTQAGNAVASFSNYGAYVDVAAPGEDIVTTGVTVTCTDANGDGSAQRGECAASGDNYVYASGTSFAAPIAAGAAVVLKALKPSATPAEIRSALYTTSVDLGVTGSDAFYGAGLLNLHAAAHKLLGTVVATNTAPTVRIVSPGAGAVGTVGMPNIVEASAADLEDGNLSANVQWNFGDGQTATGSVWGAHAYAAPGTYTITARITDRGGLSAVATVSFAVVAAASNTAPSLTISAPSTSSITIAQGTTVGFSATATDAEQGNLTASIAWTYPGSTATGGSFSLSFPSAGTATITAKVTDAQGLSASKSIAVNVTATPSSLAAPTGLTLTLGTARRVTVRWMDNATGETSYKVERAKVSSTGIGSWYLLATLGANATSYVNQPTKATWAYRVRVSDATSSLLGATAQIVVR